MDTEEDLTPVETISPDTSHSMRDPRGPVTSEAGRHELMRHPAPKQAGWLPEGVFPELDPAARRHREAVERLAKQRKDAAEQGARFKAEDRACLKAYESGTEVPAPTDPAERHRLVADARMRIEAAERELTNAAVDAVVLIQEHEDGWLGAIREQKAAAEEQIAEAGRLLEGAQRTLGEVGRTEGWVRRTADNRPGLHISMDLLGVRTPPAPIDLAALVGTDL